MPFFAKALISIVVVELLGVLGVLFTRPAIDSWYSGLVQPPGTPPNWVFAPVWTILYATIGLAFALVWHGGFDRPQARTAVVLFAIQLILNLSWTPVFFGMHQMLLGFILISLLWLTILATIVAFLPLSRAAAYLLIPYFLWVGYATYLNGGYLVLNR